MGLKFNPFSGNFDFTGGGGGGSSYIDGEEATYNDLSLDAGVAPLNSAWLVRNSSGIWPFNKPGGIYIRTATLGVSRDADYTYAGTMPDVFSDAVLTIYDEASTTRTGQFNLGSVTAGQNRVLTWPDANGTIARTETFAAPPAIGNTTPNTLAGTQLALHDGSDTGTFVAAGKLTDDRTYDLPDASGTLALLETLPAGGTKTYAVFTATDNQPPATDYATLDTRNSIAVLDFDAATDESAVFVGIIPEGASLSSGLKVRLHWMASTATADNCRWGVQFEKAGTDLDSDSFDTAAEAHSAANGTSGIETVTEITITTIDSLAAGDRFRLKVYRNADDATNDTMTGDAELVAVEVRSAA